MWHNLALTIPLPVSWENEDPQNGDPHPQLPGKMGMGVPVIPVKWGPRIPILPGLWGCLRENGDPYFTGKMGMGSLYYSVGNWKHMVNEKLIIGL